MLLARAKRYSMTLWMTWVFPDDRSIIMDFAWILRAESRVPLQARARAFRLAGSPYRHLQIVSCSSAGMS